MALSRSLSASATRAARKAPASESMTGSAGCCAADAARGAASAPEASIPPASISVAISFPLTCGMSSLSALERDGARGSARPDSSAVQPAKHGLFTIESARLTITGTSIPLKSLRYAADTEIDDLEKCGFLRRRLQRRQRVAGDLAEMAGTADRVADGRAARRQGERMLQFGLAVLVALDGALPELPLLCRAPAVREDDRKRHLALAEIVADILAEVLAVAAIVER